MQDLACSMELLQSPIGNGLVHVRFGDLSWQIVQAGVVGGMTLTHGTSMLRGEFRFSRICKTRSPTCNYP
jgi:hypothetical protein